MAADPCSDAAPFPMSIVCVGVIRDDGDVIGAAAQLRAMGRATVASAGIVPSCVRAAWLAQGSVHANWSQTV